MGIYTNNKGEKSLCIVNDIYCFQLQIQNETASFPACEWKFYKQGWVTCF